MSKHDASAVDSLEQIEWPFVFINTGGVEYVPRRHAEERIAALTRPAGGSERLRLLGYIKADTALDLGKYDGVGTAIYKSPDRLDGAEPVAIYALASPQGAERCRNCDDTGEVHRADGEWVGSCPHHAHGAEQRQEDGSVRQAAFGLREAQRAYMADRGNEAKGKAVADAAERLDAALGEPTVSDRFALMHNALDRAVVAVSTHPAQASNGISAVIHGMEMCAKYGAPIGCETVQGWAEQLRATPHPEPAATQGDASLPERDPTKPNTEQGLYRKFDVRRTDGSDAPGGKHDGCEYFVLDVRHDPLALPALAAYAQAAKATHPDLARDLIERYALSPPPGVQAAQVSDVYSFDVIEEAWGDTVPVTRSRFDIFRKRMEELRAFKLAQPGSAAHGGEDAK